MALTGFDRYREKGKTTRFYSSMQEKDVAKALNGKQTKNSGATDWQKSDVLTKDFVIECKTKMKHSESISIKKEWFLKQKQEQMFMGKKHSAITFNFGPGEQNYYIIDENLFKQLIFILENEAE